MYAELRPMLLDKSIPDDDGRGQLSNATQMELILECVERKMADLKRAGREDEFPFGLKIIYCTPRSIPRELMRREMQDCLSLKEQYPDLICGESFLTVSLTYPLKQPCQRRISRDAILNLKSSCP